MNFKGSKTYENLLRTFAGESRARNKYTLYAEKARKEGFQYIASIFEETAANELAHAREAFGRYLSMVRTTEDNLKDAAQGEAMESSKIYKDFERTAREEGFTEIADFYKELSEVEENHYNRYNEILNKLQKGMEFKRNTDVKWQCMNCGYIHIGKEAPLACPLCKYPRSFFKIYCEDFK